MAKQPIKKPVVKKAATKSTSTSGNKAYTAQAKARKEAMAKMTPAQRKRNDQLAKFGKDVLLPAATAVIPGGAGRAVVGAAVKKGLAKAAVKEATKVTKRGAKTMKSSGESKLMNESVSKNKQIGPVGSLERARGKVNNDVYKDAAGNRYSADMRKWDSKEAGKGFKVNLKKAKAMDKPKIDALKGLAKEGKKLEKKAKKIEKGYR